MRWVAIFEDSPRMIRHRKEFGRQHESYVRANRNEILIGGGFKENPDDNFVGGMWIMDVASKARAIELVENDPCFDPQSRKYKLFTWAKILDNETVKL